MAESVDQLIVEIKAETAGLRKGLDSVNRKLNTANTTAKSSILTFGNLAKVFAAIGVARLGGSIVTTSRQFEDLGATMKAITGSAEAAGVSMDLVRKFTSGTTFQLENVSSAFITLMNAGITPTSDTLKDFGNIAAAFGKDITQIAQATFNATTGETEMLKQFGIKAKLEGDKITMIFREQETTIGRNSEEIVGYLRSIGQENFSTALEERANTVSGVFSNLGDATSELFNAIGEGGLNQVLTETGRELLEMADEAKVVGAVIGQLLVLAFNKLKLAIRFVIDNIQLLMTAFTLFIALKVSATVLTAAVAFVKFAKGATAARVAMALLNKVSKGNIFLLLGIGLAAVTGALDNLTEKVQEMVSKVGEGLGLDELFEIPDGSTAELDALDAEIEKIAKSLKATEEAAKGATVTLGDELSQAVINSTQAFTKDFVDALMRGESALDSFKNFAKNIVSQIITTFLQMAVVNQILNAIFPGAGLPTFQFGAKAGGGTVQGRQPVLVGERGPEIFVPNTGGTVMNNMNSQNAMGGGGVTVVQNNNFALGVEATTRAEVQKMLPQIAETSKMAVFEAASRGGAYRKGLLGGT